MSKVSTTDVKQFIVSYLSRTLESSGRTMSRDPSDDLDLYREGIVDSVGMFNLIAEIEAHFAREIDFQGLSPEEMMVVGPLCRYIEKMLS
jgi:acyl carrier protein